MDQGNAFEVKDGRLISNLRKPRSPEEAMRHSIAKWEFIVTQGDTPINDCGTETCGLCRFHIKDWDCGTCPVSEAGYNGCDGSPYEAYSMDRKNADAKREVAFLKRIAKKYDIQWD
jgi:hypothetical protein